MNDAQNFDTIYKKLNVEQKKAVDTLEGPVMVVAGPGTGKTQVLAMRVANILRKHAAQPREILCLTFSEAGVAAMRKRLAELVPLEISRPKVAAATPREGGSLTGLAGTAGYYVPVHTFHGFCNELIREYPEEFPHIGENPPIGELESMQILEDLLKRGPYEILRPHGDPLYYARPASSHISELKREGIGPGDLAAYTVKEEKAFERIEDLYHTSGAHKGKMKGKYQDEQRRIQKNKELAHLYGAYQGYLRAEKLYDYNDMILDVLATLQQNEAFQSRIGSRYKFFLVDEHQDTNTAQNLVLELLCSEKNPPNICIVGDEKQAIYRFQGANVENFLYVHKRFPSAHIISLRENYRSSDAILTAAHALISKRRTSLAGVLENISDDLHAASSQAEMPVPQIYLCASHDDEHLFIARKAKDLIATGTPPREIAVLVREHKDALPILQALKSEGVPHVLESSSDIWHDRFVRDAMRINEFLVSLASVNPGHESMCRLEEKLFAVLHISAFGIEALDIWKLAPAISHAAHHSGTFLDALSNTKLHKDLSIVNSQGLLLLGARIAQWRSMMENSSTAELFESVLRATGVGEEMQKNNEDPRAYAGVQALWQELKNFFARDPNASLPEFQQYLALCQRHNIRLETKPQKNLHGVRIMTAHGAKGLEFDYVFIPHLHDAKWGKKKRAQAFRMPNMMQPAPPGVSGTPNKIDDVYEDERRLLYVALTRARKGIFMSHAERDEQGRELIPSLFVREMEGAIARGNHDADSAAVPFLHVHSPSTSFDLRLEKEFIADLFARRKFSVTGLNNYLECPWKYFYRTLLRVPQAPRSSELYGSAVHEALRVMFERAAHQEPYPQAFLLEAFTRALERKVLSPQERERLQARGKKALEAYYGQYSGSWNTNVRNEVALTVPLSGSLILTGVFDKIEFLGQSGSPRQEVIVVDYKTGRSKTRGEIEGTTKNSHGNLKRQLVFYKLLLDRHPDHAYRMEVGELDFVEPDKRGNFRKEQFVIAAPEVQKLEELIYKTTEEILTLSFWGKRCGNKECEWCALRFA